MTSGINIQRITNRLHEINSIGRLSGGGVNRAALSDEDKKARDLFVQWLRSLNMVIHVDEMGNIFGLWRGVSDQIIATGSHLDTVPTGGDYDGTLGVLTSLEVIETLKEQNYKPHHSLVIANFTNEEGTRFTPDMMGSLGYANPEKVPQLLSSKAVDNQKTVGEELKRIGYAGSMKCGTINFEKVIEVHIEQGPVLENEKKDIGVVNGVQAIHWRKLIITGRSAHAGTTPITMRKDALFAMNTLAVFGRALCNLEPGLLITVGSLQVFPNVINVVPSKVIATLDIRHANDEVVEQALKKLNEFMITNASFDGLTVQQEVLVNIRAIRFDPSVVNAIQKSCDKLGYSSRPMLSGAGHDAQLLSSKYASAMIFIPSKNGVSHAVDEYSSADQIEKGANVLLNTILELDTPAIGG